MHKIGDDTPTADGSGEFQEGPTPTDLRAAFLNTIQRELLELLAQASITPDQAQDDQVWQALLAKFAPVSYTAVPGYVQAHSLFLDDNSTSFLPFDATANIVDNAWESVGPTASGADNIWTDLDIVPSAATFLWVKIVNDVLAGSNSVVGDSSSLVYARRTGTSGVQVEANRVSFAVDYIQNAGDGGHDNDITYVPIPIDSSRRFDMTWHVNNGGAIVRLYLAGWGR